MLLMPKRWKYRKQMRWKNRWVATSWTEVAFGEFGMKALENGYLTNRQIESARRVLVRYVRKVWKLWIRVFPDLPYTKKWLEMPMGKGKGDVDHYRTKIKRGKIIFELVGIDRETAQKAVKLASYKLPIKVKLVEKWELR